MTEQQLKTRLGVWIIALNFSVIFTVLACFVKGGFDADQMTTLLAIVAPMFSCYGVAAIRHIAKERVATEDNSKKILSVFAVMSFVFPLLFTTVVVGAIWLQVHGRTFANFEQFKRILLILEVLFSLYIGNTTYAMFKRSEEEAPETFG